MNPPVLNVLGIIGRSGSGKTTLLTALLPRLARLGLLVSTVKHTHHAVDLDRPGKDSWRHREAGAHEVLLVGDQRWALLHERRATPPDEGGLAELLPRLAPVDLVLVEGFARTPGPRLEVLRQQVAAQPGRRPLWPGDAGVEAVASDIRPPGCDRHWLQLDDHAAICGWIRQRFQLCNDIDPSACTDNIS
ncbi:molybdopterin-guanine dinucleotide biosynthesis protein B [Lichenicoccus sp.]|uniref:molybdopterin-guanine dinucleotide biosynthesis protein B n=1 Tax=Lichenicoccus sp. TaxID=2781899 RepID=UPI003D0FEC64